MVLEQGVLPDDSQGRFLLAPSNAGLCRRRDPVPSRISHPDGMGTKREQQRVGRARPYLLDCGYRQVSHLSGSADGVRGGPADGEADGAAFLAVSRGEDVRGVAWAA